MQLSKKQSERTKKPKCKIKSNTTMWKEYYREILNTEEQKEVEYGEYIIPQKEEDG